MGKAALLCTALLLLSASSSPADQSAIPGEMQKGKAVFEAACTECHDAAKAAGGDRDREGWLKVVDEKVGDGAKVADADRDPLASYLAAGSLLRSKCSACHSSQRPLSKNKDLAGWQATVTRMSGKRPGHLSEDDVARIAGYLAAERPLP